MKLVTFKNKKGQVRIGWLTKDGQGVVDMKLTDKRLPNDMLSFIDKHEQYFKIIKDISDDLILQSVGITISMQNIYENFNL